MDKILNVLRNPITYYLVFLFVFILNKTTFSQCPSRMEVVGDGSNTLKLIWDLEDEKPNDVPFLEIDGKVYYGKFENGGVWKSKSNTLFKPGYATKEHLITLYGVERYYKNGKKVEPEVNYLISFTGLNANNMIFMNWIIMKEAPYKMYYIERRLRESWDVIDSLDALKFKTKASSVFIYEYIDKIPPTGDLVYRMKSVKADKKSSYSEIITVSNFGGKFSKLNRKDPLYRFEKETTFEVFSDKGELLLKGKGQWIDFSEIGAGTFSVKYSGNSTKIVYN